MRCLSPVARLGICSLPRCSSFPKGSEREREKRHGIFGVFLIFLTQSFLCSICLSIFFVFGSLATSCFWSDCSFILRPPLYLFCFCLFPCLILDLARCFLFCFPHFSYLIGKDDLFSSDAIISCHPHIFN